MLMNGSCRLGTAVTLITVEIQSGDSVLAESTFKGNASIDPACGVVAHSFIVVLRQVVTTGQWVLALRVNQCRDLFALAACEFAGVLFHDERRAPRRRDLEFRHGRRCE